MQCNKSSQFMPYEPICLGIGCDPQASELCKQWSILGARAAPESKNKKVIVGISSIWQCKMAGLFGELPPISVSQEIKHENPQIIRSKVWNKHWKIERNFRSATFFRKRAQTFYRTNFRDEASALHPHLSGQNSENCNPRECSPSSSSLNISWFLGGKSCPPRKEDILQKLRVKSVIFTKILCRIHACK